MVLVLYALELHDYRDHKQIHSARAAPVVVRADDQETDLLQDHLQIPPSLQSDCEAQDSYNHIRYPRLSLMQDSFSDLLLFTTGEYVRGSPFDFA